MNNIKIFIAVILFSINVGMVDAQDTASIASDATGLAVQKLAKEKPAKRFKKVYWGLKAGGGQLSWTNDLEGITCDQSIAINGGFFIEYHPIKFVAIEVGGEYFKYTANASLATISSQKVGVDDDGDAVVFQAKANNVKEEQSLALLNVPVSIKLSAFAGNWEFYGKGGMVYRHALAAEYTQSGSYTNNGWYPQWNLLVDDLPAHGYYTDKHDFENSDITWKAGMDPFVGGGIVFPGKGASFFIEGLYYPGGADLVDNKQDIPYQSRMNNESIYDQTSGSIMEMSKTKLSGFIVNIGLRF